MKCPKCKDGGIDHHMQRNELADWMDYLECDKCRTKFEMICGDEMEMIVSFNKTSKK